MALKTNELIKKLINKNALCVSEPLESCFIGSDAEKPEGMTMLAYSGKVIPNHWYWGDLAIDIKGMKFPKKVYPILEDHMTDKKIGFSKKPVKKDNVLYMEDITLLDTIETWEFVRNSKAGFPYQASIHAIPSIIEDVAEGETAEVNGYTFKGPGTIWRKSALKESSVCTFGYDSNTESKAFSEKGDIEIEYKVLEDESELSRATHDDKSIQDKNKKKETIMEFDIVKFAELQPKEYTKFVDDVIATAVDKLSVEHTEKVNTLSDELADVKGQLVVAEKKNLEFEKEEAIQKQNALVATADALWATKLSESDLPENLHEKVKLHVSHEKFIGEEGLDEEAFGAAIDEEISDWTDKGITSTVLGSGFSQKKVDDEKKDAEKFNKEVDEQVELMLASI